MLMIVRDSAPSDTEVPTLSSPEGCVCVCVCVCERERERERESVCVCDPPPMSQELCKSVLILAICLGHPYGHLKPPSGCLTCPLAPLGSRAIVLVKAPLNSVETHLEPWDEEESSSSL